MAGTATMRIVISDEGASAPSRGYTPVSSSPSSPSAPGDPSSPPSYRPRRRSARLMSPDEEAEREREEEEEESKRRTRRKNRAVKLRRQRSQAAAKAVEDALDAEDARQEAEEADARKASLRATSRKNRAVKIRKQRAAKRAGIAAKAAGEAAAKSAARGKVVGGALRGAGRAAMSAAGGGLGAAAGEATAALTRVVALAGPVGAVGVGMIQAADATVRFTKAVNDLGLDFAERIGKYSPEVQMAEAMAEIQRTLSDMARAQRLSGEMAKAIENQQKLYELTKNILEALLKTFGPLLDGMGVVLDFLNALSGVDQAPPANDPFAELNAMMFGQVAAGQMNLAPANWGPEQNAAAVAAGRMLRRFLRFGGPPANPQGAQVGAMVGGGMGAVAGGPFGAMLGGMLGAGIGGGGPANGGQ